MKCNDCLDTGWVGDNGPGKKGNNEFIPCDCPKGKAIFIRIRNRPASEISTAELIAELGRRRPDCKKCEYWRFSCEDLNCIWFMPIKKDNFKEKP